MSPKLSGQYITVTIDDSADAPKDVSSDVNSIDIPNEYTQLEGTGFSDGAVNSFAGMFDATIEGTGDFDPAADSLYNVLKGIKGKGAKTLTVAVGDGAAPTTGDPEFEGEFWCYKMNIAATPAGKIAINFGFKVSGSSPPVWDVVS